MSNTFEREIELSHPFGEAEPTEEAFKADELAMTLVGERHAKRELVNLVRWLIMDKAETARKHQGI